jgi:hypothetical protein
MSCPMVRCPYFRILYLFIYIYQLIVRAGKNIEILSCSFVNLLFLTFLNL